MLGAFKWYVDRCLGHAGPARNRSSRAQTVHVDICLCTHMCTLVHIYIYIYSYTYTALYTYGNRGQK